jgi:hypothetical protein
MNRPWTKACLALACWILGLGGGVSFAQTLQVTPNRALADEAVVIRATGLQPAEQVTLKAELTD